LPSDLTSGHFPVESIWNRIPDKSLTDLGGMVTLLYG
jgi:hypothetical protein